jgi:hypothetical protein
LSKISRVNANTKKEDNAMNFSLTICAQTSVCVLIWWCFSAHGFAQWSTDSTVNNAISTAVGQQEFPAIASDGAGGAIITWESRSTVFPYYTDIYAQRIDSSGVLRWDTNGVAISTAFSDQRFPIIVSDGASGAIIAWMDYRNASVTGVDINAQRVNSSGVVQWDTNGVAISNATGDQENPTIVSDGAGGAIITWEDNRLGTDHIYAQRIAGSGAAQWTPHGIVIYAMSPYQQQYPTIVSDGAGGAIITWQDFRNGISYDIFSQRVSAMGGLMWNPGAIAISAAANQQEFPTIASDGAGGAIIAWQDTRSDVNGDIYAQRINSTGAVQWDSNGVAIATPAGTQSSLNIVSDGMGGAIIVWQDRRGSNFDIYAQRVGASGSVLWTSNGISLCAAAGDQTSPTIVMDGPGGAIVTWQDSRNGLIDIYAQRVDATGNVLWSTNGVAVSVAAGDQKFPEIIRGTGGVIITWEDFRSGNFDIYAQQVNLNGNLGQITYVIEGSTSPSEFQLYQNYPNPFNPSTRIQFSLPRSAFVTLAVYDLLGQEVATLVNREVGPGIYEVTWNASRRASGVYFYRLQTSSFTETKKLILLR